MTGRPAEHQAPQRGCVALLVTRDADLLGWLDTTVREISFRAVDPSSDGHLLEDAAGTRVTLLDGAGFELESDDAIARVLNRWGVWAPLLVLVRTSDPRRVARLLDAGADDAMCEPFRPDEVRARVASLCRRVSRQEPLDPGRVWYDARVREVVSAAGRRRLTRSEAIVVESLLEARGRAVSRELLLRRLAQRPLEVKSNIVDRHVATLRAKLGDDSRRPRFVATVAGHGYQLLQAENAGASRALPVHPVIG